MGQEHVLNEVGTENVLLQFVLVFLTNRPALFFRTNNHQSSDRITNPNTERISLATFKSEFSLSQGTFIKFLLCPGCSRRVLGFYPVR